MTTLTIEPGIEVHAVNPSWERPFAVEEKKQQGGKTFFLCRWAAPDPEKGSDFDFSHFGVASVDGKNIVEAWPISKYKGKFPEGRDDVLKIGESELERHKCHNCARYVNFKVSQKKKGPECIQVTYTCPACKHKEVDWLD